MCVSFAAQSYREETGHRPSKWGRHRVQHRLRNRHHRRRVQHLYREERRELLKGLRASRPASTSSAPSACAGTAPGQRAEACSAAADDQALSTAGAGPSVAYGSSLTTDHEENLSEKEAGLARVEGNPRHAWTATVSDEASHGGGFLSGCQETFGCELGVSPRNQGPVAKM